MEVHYEKTSKLTEIPYYFLKLLQNNIAPIEKLKVSTGLQNNWYT